MRLLNILSAAILILTPFAAAEEERKPWVDLPAKYASELPECDRIEVFLLGGDVQDKGGEGTFPIRPYRQFSKIEKRRDVVGEDAKKLCVAWRSLTFDMWSQALCHLPIYGLRFYQGDKLRFETSVCFGCSNFYFSRDGAETSWHGFRVNDPAGKNLVESLAKIIPLPKRGK
jgi:hypothetical protein